MENDGALHPLPVFNMPADPSLHLKPIRRLDPFYPAEPPSAMTKDILTHFTGAQDLLMVTLPLL